MDRARWLVENGWKAFKGGVHPRTRPLDHYIDSAAKIEEDIQVLRWVREAVGNKLDICVDCHASWDVASAVRAAKALEEIDVLFMEEPIGPDPLRPPSAQGSVYSDDSGSGSCWRNTCAM